MTIDAHLAEELMDTQIKQRAVRQGYALGFCFMSDNTVVLIRKNKPEWQKGLLNGVGGKIEPGESAHEAMVREFREETGVLIPEWEHFVTMNFTGARVYCFKVFVPGILPVSTCTDELVNIKDAEMVLRSSLIIPNLKWLIPMALHDSQTTEPHWKGAPTLMYL